jgi:hypothetical protein
MMGRQSSVTRWRVAALPPGDRSNFVARSFAKIYIQEMGSEKLDDFLQNASELAQCVILVPELILGL